jgi:hypothetical protein
MQDFCIEKVLLVCNKDRTPTDWAEVMILEKVVNGMSSARACMTSGIPVLIDVRSQTATTMSKRVPQCSLASITLKAYA